jgi:hypothetical protein
LDTLQRKGLPVNSLHIAQEYKLSSTAKVLPSFSIVIGTHSFFCTNCTTLNMTKMGKFYKKVKLFCKIKGASHTACPLFLFYLYIIFGKNHQKLTI